ncbi:MAG TPA: RNA methyltransferase [Cellvibrionaceae bacterium]
MSKPSIPHSDSAEYREKKRLLARMLTIYGRNPVLEALQDNVIKVFRLHLADSNKPNAQLSQMQELAKQKGAEIVWHSKQALSRISKNSQQDQGVALDVITEGFRQEAEWLDSLPDQFELLAVDSVTNPQNLGMIIRSLCASPMHGLLLPEKGCAKLDALVIKASAGTLFRTPIIHTANLAACLARLKQHGCGVYGLDAQGTASLAEFQAPKRCVMVMGNESTGLSSEVKALCDGFISIPMNRGVESLNVSVAASLIAFRRLMR